MRQIVKNFFGKAVMSMLVIAMLVSAAWFFEGEASVAYAADDKYYFVEPVEDGIEITENMTAPKPTTEGKETYIFAGYFADENCETPVTKSTSEKVYKKFVPAEIMSVKAQVTKGTKLDSDKTDMRLVTTVDGLNYKEVGFDVYFNGATTPVNAKTTTVYKRIIAADKGNAFGYSPEAFDVDSDYFTTVNLVNIANKNFDKTFFIKPYWKTLDGTKVYGLSRMARVSDSYNKIVNIPIRLYTDDTVNAGTFDVAYDTSILTYKGYDNGDVFASVTATDNVENKNVTVTTPAEVAGADSMVVNLRFQVKDGQAMPSNSTFAVTSDTFTTKQLANVTYKMFSVTYQGEPDTSWYDEFNSETTFVITTAADLYGLASIVNATDGDYKNEQFSGDTIKLGADLDLNTSWSAPKTADEDVVVPANTWTPIGNDKKFQGIFDGKEHEIKGVYVTGDTTNLGLFGGVDGINSMVMNLNLTNSYVEHTGATAFVGGVVGYLNKGTIKQVYSNAIVKSNGIEFGGIVGRAEGLVEECWFNGEVYANRTDATYVKAAGIVGTSWSQTGTGKAFTPLTIRNCLNTGKVIYNVTTTSGSGAGLGGIYGGDRGYTDLTIENCINTGIIESNQKNGTGSIVGNVSKSTIIDEEATFSVADITNCYGTTDTITAHLEDAQDGRILGYTKNCDVTQNNNVIQDAENMNGHVAYDTINGGLSVLTSQVKDGIWAIREQSDNLKDGVPIPATFADDWIDVAWYYDVEKAADKGETYSISTAEELYGFSAISQDYNFEDDTIQLVNDINANIGKASAWAAGTTIPDRQWKAIGKDTPFAGTFDGQEKTISGIYVNETTDNAGLFAKTEYNVSIIKNIRLKNSYIYSNANNVGSIIGYSNRTKLTNIYSDAYVESTVNRVGGIVGDLFNASNSKDLSKCWFDGSVKGSTYVGGIAGRYNVGESSISDVLVTGEVKSIDVRTSGESNVRTGGIIGGTSTSSDVNLTIETSVHVGTVEDSYTGEMAHKTGGVIGHKQSGATVSLDSVYTTFAKDIGASAGTASTKNDVRTSLESNHVEDNNVYGNDNFTRLNLDYYLYDSIWVARKNDTTVPRCFVGTVVDENDIVEDTSAHTSWYDADPDAAEFVIKTENDFLGFAEIVNASEGTYANEQFSGKTVKLAKDMHLNRGWNVPKTVDDSFIEPDIIWTPIGGSKKFQGTFDGQGKNIKGIYVAQSGNYVGLFGAAQGATITNFSLMNSYFEQTGNNHWTGSAVGYIYENDSIVSRIYSDAIVISAGRQIGGIAGRAEGTVTKCWYNGEIKATRSSSNILAGGIVGASNISTDKTSSTQITISNCLNSADIIYNVAHSKTTNVGVGGIYGATYGATANIEITECINSGEIKLQENAVAGAVAGLINQASTVYDISNCYTRMDALSNKTVSATSGILGATVNSPQGAVSACDAKSLTELQGVDVYKEVAEGGLDLNYATWIARTNDVPVPRCFVGSIVDAKDTIEDNSGRVYIDTDWYEDNPDETSYSIETAHELAGLAQLVNDEGVTFNGKTINLIQDIDLNKGWTAPATATDEVEVPLNAWIPIGATNNFQGTFDGHGHEIKGVYVTGDTTKLGLFGYVNGENAMVTDLSLTNSHVEHSGATVFVGSVVGYLNRGTIDQVYSNAIVKSNGTEFGGIVGRAEGLVEGCWFDGEVYANRTDATYVKAAGIVGTSWSNTGSGDTDNPLTIRNCLNTGKVIYNVETTSGAGAGLGGIYGGDRQYTDLTVEYCLNTGIVETNQANGTGSIVGNISKSTKITNTTLNGVTTYSTAEITNCYSAPDTISNRTDGRILGYNNANCTVTQTDNLIVEKDYIFGLGAQLLTNLDFVQDSDESIWAARRGQIPAPAGLVAESDKLNVRFGKADTDIADGATGDGVDDPYVIENVEELYGFAILSRTDNFANKYIKLSDDIENDVFNLNPGESAEDWAKGTAASLPWYSIGVASDNNRFAGHFDGNGKTISGIYMNQDSRYLGMFAATETGSTIANLRLMNSYFNYTGNGTANVGSIVGDLRGDLTEVYSDAIIHSNGEHTGGLVALVNETSTGDADAVHITNCWYDGQITSSKRYIGGLVATVKQGSVTIENSLNTCVINNTYSAGHAFVGGICGRVEGQAVVDVTDCIASGKITDACGGLSVKAVVGYVAGATASAEVTSGSTVNFTDVFVTKNTYGRALPNKQGQKLDDDGVTVITYPGVYNGTIIRTHEADRLIGYCTEEVTGGEIAPSLDFTSDWTIRTSDVPVPACFENLVTSVTVADGSTLDETLNAQIGLDSLGLSVANAVNMGEGNYVLRTTVDDTAYNSYLTNLESSLGFGEPVANNSEGAGADGVHSVSYKKQNPDWVLTLTYVEATDVLTISINTDTDSLSDNLVYTEGVDDENYLATGDITLNMLQLSAAAEDEYADLTEYGTKYNSYWYGNSFVIQLPNGHFIINDGGAKEEFVELATYLKGIVGTTEDGMQKPVYIDAWTVSHQHADHFDIVKAVVDDPTVAEGIYVDAFYISEPNAKTLALGSLDGDVDKQYYGMTLFTKGENDEQTDIYRMQTGQRYYFNGIIMDVIQAQEQIPYSEYAKVSAMKDDLDFNTASAVLLFTTSNNQKVLIGGDANYVNMGYIMKAYDSNVTDEGYTPTSLLQNINVLVAFHHGKNMSMEIGSASSILFADPDYSFIDYLTNGGHLFDYVLYPCSLVYDDDSDPVYAFPNAGEANAYLNKKVKNNNYKHYGDDNVVITLQ